MRNTNELDESAARTFTSGDLDGLGMEGRPGVSCAPRPVVDTLRTVFVARALHVVTELGVAQALVDRPRSCVDLAAELGADPVRLLQVVRTAASVGLFSRVPGRDVGVDRRWRLTSAGETLLPGHPAGTRDLVLTMQGAMFLDCMAVLGERVRTGISGPELARGTTFFDHLAAHPEEAVSFDRMMTSIHGGEFEAVARAVDLGGASTLVDVGGGVGELSHILLGRHPQLRATILEIASVASHARARATEAGFADRCTAVAGNFFRAVPAGADAYLLSYVLHDWDDEECVRILSRVAAAMAPAARLLIVEMVLPDDDSPHPGNTLDMVMATMTTGVERSATEYEQLLVGAGLRLEQVIGTDSAVSVVVGSTA